jgi:hypothetical protein
MWLRGPSSTAPPTQSARVSHAIVSPSPRTRLLFHAAPKLTGFMKLVGQTVVTPSASSMQDDCTPWMQFLRAGCG